MLRNFLGAQVNVTKGRVDETVPCDGQRRTAATKRYRQCGVIGYGLGLGLGGFRGSWGWKLVGKEFGVGRGILKARLGQR
jgi:hypothetical protein